MVKEKIPFFAKNAIGSVPNEWEINLLEKEVFFQEGPGIRKRQFGKPGIPFINIRCMEDGKVNHEDLQYVKQEEFEDRYEHFLLEEGDTIVSASGTLGKMAVIKKEDLPLMLNTSVIRFRPDSDKLNTEYMRQYLRSDSFLMQFEFMSQGSAQVNVGPTHLKQMYIVMPSFPEQKKIASILSSVDKSIDKTDEVIEKINELKKGLMQELLTKGIGHSEFKEVGVGMIPESWEYIPLKNICEFKNGKSTDYYSDLEKGLNYIYGSNGPIGSLNKTNLKSGFIIGRVGAVGEIHKINKPVWVSDNAIKAEIKNIDKVEVNFLYYWLKRRNLGQFSTKSAQPLLNQSTVKSIPIPLPKYPEQKKIASILSSVDTKIQKEEEYKTKLERLKKGLMQKLLTGEIRVNTEMEV